MTEQNKTSQPDNGDDVVTHPPTLVGWAARVFSLGLIASLVGAILYQIAAPDREVAFEVVTQISDAREVDNRFLTPIEITNTGSKTAGVVKLEVLVDGKAVEISIPMIGQQETVSYVIGSDTRVSHFQHKIISYEAP
ncbi:hypothetical protein [Qipengyuania marisflavi]|uniref:TIGR02588 family protein n=1 Tax=Qipengyuania marisflavi TaxID=2486356 RepID=A0A5S3P2N3_9SPHN|nr:hypothetical protein [Qipengyuania marisflavi]TMM47196.1 hypothetical protein FEV51_10460 [Qipengyuania marisflavi]